MPKVKLNHNFEGEKKLSHSIDAAIAYKGMTQAELARKCGMSPPTFCRRKNNPQDFTLKEIRDVIRATGIDKELILEVIG